MFWKLVFGSLWGRKGRIAAAWAALVVPAALLTGGANFLIDASQKLKSEIRSTGPNLIVRSDLPLSLGRFASIPHASRLDSIGEVSAGERRSQAPIVRVDALIWPWWRIDGDAGVVVGRRLADRLRVTKGDAIRVDGRDVRITGLLENEGEEERAVVFVGPLDRFTRADFVLEGNVDQVASEMRAAGLPAEPVRALTAQQGAVAQRLRTIFVFVAVFVLILSGLGTAATFSALVQEQRREIGLASALGARPAQVARFLAAQGGAILLLAFLAGGGLGIVLSDFMGRRVFGLGTEIRPLAFAVALAACGLSALVALVVPVRRALSVAPSVVLREE